jgi:hypothetical protein
LVLSNVFMFTVFILFYVIFSFWREHCMYSLGKITLLLKPVMSE